MKDAQILQKLAYRIGCSSKKPQSIWQHPLGLPVQLSCSVGTVSLKSVPPQGVIKHWLASAQSSPICAGGGRYNCPAGPCWVHRPSTNVANLQQHRYGVPCCAHVALCLTKCAVIQKAKLGTANLEWWLANIQDIPSHSLEP